MLGVCIAYHLSIIQPNYPYVGGHEDWNRIAEDRRLNRSSSVDHILPNPSGRRYS